jgi:tetratricopeptide (TPR) repeat protein
VATRLLAAGTLVAGRFEIELPVGSGGMGAVYRARDHEGGRTVALKLIHRTAGSAQDLERFGREATLLAELRHPGIVAYVAHGQTPDGQLFLAMEWLEGHDLGRRLPEGPLSLGESLVLLRRVAEALEVAHRRGVIHRDLKPSNLFLREGKITEAVLLDFGIARQLVGAQSITRTGVMVGTPEYMSPEQVRGERSLSPAADIFTLGCVLYECLAGRRPFTSDHMASVLGAILFQDPPPIRQVRPSVPEPLALLLERMMAKDPAGRPQGATGLLDELGRLGELVLPPEEDAPALRATLIRPVSTSGLPRSIEQQLFSVVLATPHTERVDFLATIDAAEMDRFREEHAGLRSALQSLGAQVEWFADGSLVATLTRTTSATDQVALAARCALLIQDRWPLARVALATGRGALLDELPVGEAVNRAAELVKAAAQGPTSPGSGAPETWRGILIDSLSADLLASRFVIERAADRAVLQRERTAVDETRLLLGRPTPCVGREQELSMLDAMLAGCIDESLAKAVLVTAAPGVGKSRLRHEFLRRLRARAPEVTTIIGYGELMSAGSPYGILAQALRRLCDIQDGHDGEEVVAQKCERLEARLGRHVPPAERRRVCEFLGELCHVPFPDKASVRLRAARNDPKLMSEQVQRAFVDFVAAECVQGPLVLVLEDLQWGDALSVRLLDALLRELSDQPLMVVALARPEVHEIFPKLWNSPGRHEIALQGLGRKACERLIRQVLNPTGAQAAAAAQAIPQEIVERIVEQAAGNALFLEELIRAVAEGKGDALPETVLAMLQARLFRIDPDARRLLRAASIFGQTFWQGAAAALVGKERDSIEVETWLEMLTREELIEKHRHSRFPSEAEYGFRHALMREAVYGLVSEEDARVWHHQAAEYLEAAGEHDPCILAEHYQRGGALVPACERYLLAADQSLASHDLDGALDRVARGLECQPEGETRGTLLQIRCLAEVWHLRWKEAQTSSYQALALLPVGSLPWFKAIWVALTMNGLLSHDSDLGGLAEKFLGVTPPRSAYVVYLQATTAVMAMYAMRGLRKQATAFFRKIEQIEPELDLTEAQSLGWICLARSEYMRAFDPDPWAQHRCLTEAVRLMADAGNERDRLVALIFSGQALGELGRPDEGEALLRETAVRIAERGETYLDTNCKVHLAALLASTGDPFHPVHPAHPAQAAHPAHPESEARREEAVALATELTKTPGVSPGFRLWALQILAEVALSRGDLVAAEARAREAFVPTPAVLRRLKTVAILIRALLGLGRHDEARSLAEEHLTWMEGNGGAGYNEVPLRLAIAQAFAHGGDVARAREVLRQALGLLQHGAERIPDVAARRRYLTGVPQNVLAVQEARALGEDVSWVRESEALPAALNPSLTQR